MWSKVGYAGLSVFGEVSRRHYIFYYYFAPSAKLIRWFQPRNRVKSAYVNECLRKVFFNYDFDSALCFCFTNVSPEFLIVYKMQTIKIVSGVRYTSGKRVYPKVDFMLIC